MEDEMPELTPETLRSGGSSLWDAGQWADFLAAHADEWQKAIDERKWAEQNYTRALQENVAYRAQFKGIGITPYLDRMAELQDRIDILLGEIALLKNTVASGPPTR